MSTIQYPNGVTLSKKPDARGAYRIRRASDGTDIRRTDPAEARLLAEQLASGEATDPFELRPATCSFADLVADYLEPGAHDEEWAISTRQSRERICRAWLLPQLGNLKVTDWTEEHTRDLLSKMEQEGLARSTRRYYLQVLRGIASYGIRRKLLVESPCEGVKVAARGRGGVRVAGQSTEYIDPSTLPTAEDIEKLASAMEEVAPGDHRRLQVLLSAYSGLRVGEMLALKAKHVDLSGGTIAVREAAQSQSGNQRDVAAPKGRKVRTTIFPEWLDPMLAERLAELGPNDLLFPGYDGRLEVYATFTKERFGKARDACGFDWRWHDLRHFFCTWALAPAPDGLGLPVQDVALFAGHHSPSFTYSVYVGVQGDAVARARRASRGGE